MVSLRLPLFAPFRERRRKRTSNRDDDFFETHTHTYTGSGAKKETKTRSLCPMTHTTSSREEGQKKTEDVDEEGVFGVPKIERRLREEERRLFVPDEEKAGRSPARRDKKDGIAGRTLAESGYGNVERRKVLDPPRKNHGIFPGARLPRDERFRVDGNTSSGKEAEENDDDDDDEDETESLRKLPQYASESERFRKIDLAEEQKRERETLRAKRDERDQLRRLQNAEREKQKQEKERLAREMEETRLNFKRTHVGNRPNQSGCGWDPVNMKLNDRRVREEDLKEEERMRIKREMVEKRTNSESFDIVTHLERCSSRGKAKERGVFTSENFNDFVGI